MPRALYVVSTFLCHFLAVALTCAAAQDPGPAGKTPPAAKKADTPSKNGPDKTSGKTWPELVARHEKITKTLDELQEKFETADLAGKNKIKIEFEKLAKEFKEEIEPAMAKLAPVVFEKTPTDAVAGQFVVGQAIKEQKYADAIATFNKLIKAGTIKPNVVEQIIGILLEENRYADVAAITDKLVEAKDANPRLLIIDSMAHFYMDDFDAAKALAKRSAAADPAMAEGADGFAKMCDDYAVNWKKEQAIRAKEAQADDLPRVVFKTSKGDVVLELFENEAPNTVANFISLVEAKKYDGTKFHRVIPKFMAQGGDPNSVDDDPSDDGRGGPGYAIACECYTEKARKHFQGSLSMAHAGKDTGGSQFFLTHGPRAQLDWAPDKTQSNHTVFGRIIDGLDAALALRVGDTIESAKVVRKRDHKYVPVKIGDEKKSPAKKAP